MTVAKKLKVDSDGTAEREEVEREKERGREKGEKGCIEKGIRGERK